MKEQTFEFSEELEGYFQNFEKSTKKNGHAGEVRTPDTSILVKIEKSPKLAFFSSNWLFSWKKASNWLFWWKNTILNVSEELEGYFKTFQKIKQKINQKNGHAG